jgi:hypothetical protein
VDDTGNAGLLHTIHSVVNKSVLSAYILFASPEETPARQPVINPHKWMDSVLPELHYLGFWIDSRSMTVLWPLQQQEKLANMLDDLWLNFPDPVLTPKQISQPLGLICHGATVSLFGVAFSLQLHYRLTDKLCRSLKISYSKGRPTKPDKRWWSLGRVKIPTNVISDLQILRAVLLDPQFVHLWSRPIGHLVYRHPMLTSYSDNASYSELGGYSVQVQMMW